MMFAIDGPIASISAPAGMCVRIQPPASLPPGTPPEPARNLPDEGGWIRPQAGIASVTATPAVASALNACAVWRRPANFVQCSGQSANVRAARIAIGGAIGSRYWKPFTG